LSRSRAGRRLGVQQRAAREAGESRLLCFPAHPAQNHQSFCTWTVWAEEAEHLAIANLERDVIAKASDGASSWSSAPTDEADHDKAEPPGYSCAMRLQELEQGGRHRSGRAAARARHPKIAAAELIALAAD